MNTCTIDQDIFNLKRECDEKDATIKELVTTLQSTENARSKVLLQLCFLLKKFQFDLFTSLLLIENCSIGR